MNKNPENPTEYFRWEFGTTIQLMQSFSSLFLIA